MKLSDYPPAFAIVRPSLSFTHSFRDAIETAGLFLLELTVLGPLAGAAVQVELPSSITSPAANRTQKVFQTECVELFADVMQLFGVPKSVGQIYGLLYATPIPMSFSDIVEQIDISKGSASQGLQLLRSLGAVRLVEQLEVRSPSRFPSHSTATVLRRDYYEPELSLRKLVSGVLHERVAPLTATRVDRLARLRELAERDGEGKDFYLGRVRQLETWRRRLKTVLPVLSVTLGPKSRK